MPDLKKMLPLTREANEGKVSSVLVRDGPAGIVTSTVLSPEGRRGIKC